MMDIYCICLIISQQAANKCYKYRKPFTMRSPIRNLL